MVIKEISQFFQLQCTQQFHWDLFLSKLKLQRTRGTEEQVNDDTSQKCGQGETATNKREEINEHSVVREVCFCMAFSTQNTLLSYNKGQSLSVYSIRYQRGCWHQNRDIWRTSWIGLPGLWSFFHLEIIIKKDQGILYTIPVNSFE